MDTLVGGGTVGGRPGVVPRDAPQGAARRDGRHRVGSVAGRHILRIGSLHEADLQKEIFAS